MPVPAVAKPPKCTPTELEFAHQFMIDRNATQACIRMGAKPKNARDKGYRLLTKVGAKQAIARLTAERALRLQPEQDEVVQNLVQLQRSNIADFLPEDHHLMQHATRDQLYGLTEATITEASGKVTRIKLDNRQKASELLGRHLGVFEADNSQKRYNPAMTEEEAQARILSVLQRMKSPPVDLEQAEDAEVVPSDVHHED